MLKPFEKFKLKIFFILILFVFASVNDVFAKKDIVVNINTVEKSFSSKPLIINNRAMFPLRDICEYLGAEVDYDNKKRTVFITKGKIKAELKIDSGSIKINGDSFDYDTFLKIVNKRAYVPAIVMADITDSTVIWNHKKKTVLILNEDLIKEISSLSKIKQDFIKKAVKIDEAYSQKYANSDIFSTADYVQTNGEFEYKWQSLIDEINEKLNTQKNIDINSMNSQYLAQKEKRIKNSGLEMEGGTGQVIAQTYASLYATRERAYELMILYLE